MKIPIKNIYYLLLYAWDCLDESAEVLAASEKAGTWVDLAGRLLVAWMREQRRRGFDQNYSDAIETTTTVRGKILCIPTVRYGHLSRGRVVCTVDGLNYDTLPNRIVKAALLCVLDSRDLDRELAQDVRSELKALSRVGDSRLTVHLCHYAQTSSNNRSYRLPISIARLLADHALATEKHGSGAFRDFDRDGGPMAALFESFVLQFLRREQTLFKASSKTIEWDVPEAERKTTTLLPRMKTDVTLEGPTVHTILEAKYYAKPLSEYFGSEKLRASHLYQLFSYLENYDAANRGLMSLVGILLYAQPTGITLDAEFALHGRPVRVLTIDLSQEWRSIKADLLSLVDWANAQAKAAGIQNNSTFKA